jgi:hypothetical protein
MKIDNLLILVVSLENASERRRQAETQLDGYEFRFVSAINGETDLSMGNQFVTAPVDAIWNSHKKAYREFLSSEMDFCLILEDDFLFINPKSLPLSLVLFIKLKADIVQLGWLQTGPDIRLQRLFEGVTYFFFRCLNRIAKFSSKTRKAISEKMRPQRTRRFPAEVIPDSFLPGAHGYLISRNFAAGALQVNSPTFLSADDFLIAVTKMRSFDVCRSRRSLIGQFGASLVGSHRFTQK